MINLHHHITPFEAIPDLVKHYRLEAYHETSGWHSLAEITDNHKRKQVHSLASPVLTDRIRVVIEETNGTPYAEIIEIRAYS